MLTLKDAKSKSKLRELIKEREKTHPERVGPRKLVFTDRFIFAALHRHCRCHWVQDLTRYQPDAEKIMLEKECALATGKNGPKINRIGTGSKVLLYANQVGIIGAGIATADKFDLPWSTSIPIPLLHGGRPDG
jgi:hypothetical protein